MRLPVTTQPADILGEPLDGAPQSQPEPRDLARTAFDHAQLAVQRYLSLAEAAEYFRFPSGEAFWCWAKRQGLRACKVGRLNLYRRQDLEAHIERSLGLATGADAPRPRLVTRTRGGQHASDGSAKPKRVTPERAARDSGGAQ